MLTASGQLKDPYLHDVVERAYPFLPSTRDKLKDTINHLVNLYAKCVTKGSVVNALKQLRVHQREHIAWERDTVWRQMIGKERRGESDGQMRSLDELATDATAFDSPSSSLTVPTPFGPLKVKKKKFFLPVAIAVFIALLEIQVVEGVEANNCFAILVFATLLWATEVRL